MVLIKHGVGGRQLLHIVVMRVVVGSQRSRVRGDAVVEERLPVFLTALEKRHK